MITKKGNALGTALSLGGKTWRNVITPGLNTFFIFGYPAWNYFDGSMSAGGAIGSSLGFAAGDALGRKIGHPHPFMIPFALGMLADHYGGKLGDKLFSTKRKIKTPMGLQDRSNFTELEKTSSLSSDITQRALPWLSKKIRGGLNNVGYWILGKKNLAKPYNPNENMFTMLAEHPWASGITGVAGTGGLIYLGNRSFNNTQQAVDNYYQNYYGN